MWALIAGTILVCWVINARFLRFYLTYEKQEILVSGFELVESALRDADISDDSVQRNLEAYCASNNIAIYISDSIGGTTFSYQGTEDQLNQQFLITILTDDEESGTILAQGDNYTIMRQQESGSGVEIMSLYGYLDDGSLIIMRISIESIDSVVRIASTFLAYIGIIALLVSAFVVINVSKNITGPILQLTRISKRMSMMDFDVKYESKYTDNEIDELGRNMNDMACRLENTISELKTANNKLQADIERRTKSEEMRKEFLSGVSHELKTPIAIIQGYAEGLEESVLDDEESKMFYCQVIKEEAQKMNSMVRELLSLNQLEYGQDFVNMEKFNIIEVIYGIVNASDILTKQDDITVLLPHETELMVWADDALVEKVVSNYFSNAIHYVKGDVQNGEKVIEISCEKRDKLVRINVFNTGEPIPEEELERIWDKFYKIDKARTREYGGSGIGLSVVKAAMESFGQQCGAENTIGGVVFWFELELAE